VHKTRASELLDDHKQVPCPTVIPAELLAVDLGTSSVKVGLFARDGRLLSFARRTYALIGDEFPH